MNKTAFKREHIKQSIPIGIVSGNQKTQCRKNKNFTIPKLKSRGWTWTITKTGNKIKNKNHRK